MSTCAPWTLKNECANHTCKHEKDSHHQGKDNCLVLHCDCKAFKKPGQRKRSGLAVSVPDDDEAPSTPRMPGWPWT